MVRIRSNMIMHQKINPGIDDNITTTLDVVNFQYSTWPNAILDLNIDKRVYWLNYWVLVYTAVCV